MLLDVLFPEVLSFYHTLIPEEFFCERANVPEGPTAANSPFSVSNTACASGAQ